jgi:methylmalonyl-CoA mutase N-terminal domain/subunit
MANWDQGQVSTLKQGQTLTCTTLAGGQIYGIILYNNQGNDQNATVNVVTSNSTQPVSVTVPGTTGNAGLASVVLVSGTDTSTVSISITASSAAPSVLAWLGSVSMPINTQGLTNLKLQSNGQKQPFAQCYRYFTVPASSWQALTITSSITQFVSIQFQENFATVYICNPGPNAAAAVTPIGPSVVGKYTTVLGTTPPQTISTNLFGNGTQWVWMSADSSQNSSAATIALQALSLKALE